jgi:predicted RNA methylase
MRLAAQAKLGFYPAHPFAVAGILRHLKLAEHKIDRQCILDPCAGKGLAIRQIADGLGLANEQVYAVELDKARTEAIKENLPGANVLGPATFLGVQITGFSYGLVYCNPPFDHELGGGRREEMSFVQASTRLLVPKGVLVLVCPIDTVIGNRSFIEYLDSFYENIQVYKFPDGTDPDTGQKCRPYNEIALFAQKRKCEIPRDKIAELGELSKRGWHWRGYARIDNLPPLGAIQPKSWCNGQPSYDRHEDIHVWEVPPGWKPHTFRKTTFTEEELAETLDASPLGVHFKDVPPLSLERPPLPLDKGHLGLILASGMLDGVVPGPHGPHVVRGSSMKKEYHNKELSTSEENPDTGAVTTKDVFSQRMITVIRCVTQDGAIHTFSNDVKEDRDGDDLLDE